MLNLRKREKEKGGLEKMILNMAKKVITRRIRKLESNCKHDLKINLHISQATSKNIPAIKLHGHEMSVK